MRMAGGFPVVPVYDLKIKDGDLVAGTHGRSFWILDDITPLRELADGATGTRLITPRTTVRTKLHFAALRSVGTGVSFSVAAGIGGGIRTFEKPDGTTGREHLDVGENPPNGAIVLLLAGGRCRRTGLHHPARRQREPRSSASAATTKRSRSRAGPRHRPGLNRFVWDMRHQAPAKLDQSLMTPRNKPLSKEPDPTAGPTTLPGGYRVELTVGETSHTAQFAIVKDPRLSTTEEDFRAPVRPAAASCRTRSAA